MNEVITKQSLRDYKPGARWSRMIGKGTALGQWAPDVRQVLVLPVPRDFKKILSSVFSLIRRV